MDSVPESVDTVRAKESVQVVEDSSRAAEPGPEGDRIVFGSPEVKSAAAQSAVAAVAAAVVAAEGV